MKAALRLFFTAGMMAMLVAICATGATIKKLPPAVGPYLVTNDNAFGSNGATIYKIAANGSLTLVTNLKTGGGGNGGGFFASPMANVAHSTTQACSFVSDGNPNFSAPSAPDVAAIDLKTLKVVGVFPAGASDNGTNDGVGLADAGNFLVAAFTGNFNLFLQPRIGTYQIMAGCKLKYLGSIPALGIGSPPGVPLAMKATPDGKTLVVTFADSSIASYSISSTGKLKLVSREFSSTGSFVAGVDITANGKWAIFGNASNPPSVDIAPIKAGGVLGATVHYSPFNVSVNSNNVLLSPDQTVLYVSNNSLGTVGASPFNKTTGVVDIAQSCTSGILRLFDLNWIFGAGLSLSSNSGTGGKIYLAETGSAPAGIAILNYGKEADVPCEITEDPSSPASDPNQSFSLLSIGRYPPRPF